MIDLPWPTLLGVALAVLLAYTVYGISGFGANLVAMPLLAHLLPLRLAVAMLLVFDLCAGAMLVIRHGRHMQRQEMLRLMPWLLIGMVAGVTLLSQASERLLLMLLGGFVLCCASVNLLQRAATSPLSTHWAAPTGVVGGVFTALYGTGGPIYTLYLARRLQDKTVLRSTIGVMIFINSWIRLALFTGAGLMSQPALLPLALWLLPVALGGHWLGSHMHLRMPAAQVMRLVWGLLLVGGVGLLWRALVG